ncbi:ligase-associated DNA damage response endonuclease PdeM [Novosphingobium piscinae]|uniref:Ligase-associated DNA damage response endonuclease PdeM n=1 Tax=Novosphingobium piscinae TaxID=1507448 RepID=A0A7X1KQU3_9SPHN|nr:ligase-associated DNA damage response endonuclease PdeM [Novosphingobium piscinae]MBC2669943.1 ligase-associated DNA damage response endonuclease PdeM [Novosphingobium piscinae]
MVPFSFAGQEWRWVAGRKGGGQALFWPAENALLVADLHLEKASAYARTGQFLPPYDSRETLGRVAAALRQTGARRVFCLGDNFHDAEGPARLEPHAAGMLAALTRATDWVWITGNHDPVLAPAGTWGGMVTEALAVGGVALRHQASAATAAPELSGHYHPKLRVRVRGRQIARPCAVRSERQLVLPAFGALTGGMDAADPAILAALQPARAIDAVLAAGDRLVEYPLWRG